MINLLMMFKFQKENAMLKKTESIQILKNDELMLL